MKTIRTRNMLAAALATALLSPLAWAQSGNAADAAAQAEPMPASPPVAAPSPAIEAVDQQPMAQQPMEEPMTAAPPAHSQAGEHAAEPSAVAQHEMWMKLDADRDGRVSAAEASEDAGVHSRFAMMDSDGDGYLSADEYRAQERMAQGHGDMPMHGDMSMHDDAWSRLDTDGDGRVSSVEASMDPAFSAHLSAMDADSDGFVTDSEYRSFAHTMPKAGDDTYRTSGDTNIDEEAGMSEAERMQHEEEMQKAEEAADDRDD